MSRVAEHRLDDGFSLVEVVVAMFIFALVAIAILPAAVGAVRLSTANEDSAAANAYASSLLAQVRADFPDGGSNSCAALVARHVTPPTTAPAATPTATPSPSPAGIVSMTPATCSGATPSATAPRLFTVTARVADTTAGLHRPLVTMSTQIVVTAP